MHIDRINFLDLYFDRLSFEDVRGRLEAASSTSRYEYLVTPNVDHVVRLDRQPRLRTLYDTADLCVCDSRILKLLARLRGIKLPLVAGSDLSAALFEGILRPGDRIAIVGADRTCVKQLQARFPESEFVHLEPPMNLQHDQAARSVAATFIARSGARFTFIAVGSPQQEMIANETRLHPSASGFALCIGAGLDFITGKQKRAPKLLQKLGVEWAHRLLSNPRRLWRRYLIDGIRIFPIWLRWRPPLRRRAIVSATTVVVLVCAASLYVVIQSHGGRSSSVSLNLRLPPPTTMSAAAVQTLPPPNLLKPVPPDEAAKANAQRPFVQRTDSPASEFILKTDSLDRARALTCLAQAVYYEAAGEGTDGGRAVAQVVLNRMRHPGFPSTICGVVYDGADRPAGCQFSFTCDGSMQRSPVPRLWARSKQIAEEALKGYVYAPVGHATHYHADYVLPYWADSLDKSVQVGRHIFYRIRAAFGEAHAFSQRYGGSEPPYRETGSTNVIPPTSEGQQLADKLMAGSGDNENKGIRSIPKPDTPLIVDEAASTLLADGGQEAHQPQVKKRANDCGLAGEDTRLGPLKANDMRSAGGQSAC